MEFEQPDSMRLKDVILGKRLFFVPNTFLVPEELTHEQFILKPVKAKHAELNSQAVMSIVDHLTGAIGRRDWPGDLTLKEDKGALEGNPGYETQLNHIPFDRKMHLLSLTVRCRPYHCDQNEIAVPFRIFS